MRIAWQVLRTLGGTLLVAGSLLAFPQHLPAVVLAWLLAVVAATALGRERWPILIALVAVLAAKQPLLAPALVVFALACAGLGAVEAARWKRGGKNAQRWPLALLAVAWVGVALDWHRGLHAPRAKFDERPIAVLGDSLSADGWPKLLAKRVKVPVVDLAAIGVSAKQALKHMRRIAAARPQCVIIELGGHDFLHGDTRSETRERLEKLIACAKSCDATVVLFEVPRGFVFDAYRGLERELAREHGCELVPDGAVRWLVLRSVDGPLGPLGGVPLSDDGLHPNDEGHRWLEGHVESALRAIYGEAPFGP